MILYAHKPTCKRPCPLCACPQVGYEESIRVAMKCVLNCWQLSLDLATAKYSSIPNRPFPSFSKVDVHTNVVRSPSGPEVRVSFCL